MSNKSNIVFLNKKTRICKKLPMSKRVKGETNIIFVDGHYVPYGEVYCEGVKDHYVHYGHYKDINTARGIVTLDLLSKGHYVEECEIIMSEELTETLSYNNDLKRLFELAVKEMFLRSLNVLDKEDEDIINDIMSGKIEISFEGDIPF